MKEEVNKKVLLPELSDALSRRKGITKKDSELFVRSVFEVIEQYLLEDNVVKIKGLGTFKLISVDSRESINVNTGERFEIKGHTKVSFTPDASLRDQINKPFAEFETIILNKEVDVEEMERLDSVPEEVSTVVEEMETMESQVEVVEETHAEIEPTNEIVSQEDVVVEQESSIDETIQEEEIVEETTPENIEETEPVKADVEPEISTPNADEIDTSISSEEDVRVEETSRASDEVLHEHVVETTITSEENNVETECLEDEEDMKGLRITKFRGFVLFIIIIALMAVSYYAGYNRVLPICCMTSCEPETEVVEAVQEEQTEVVADTLAVATDSLATATDVDAVAAATPVESADSSSNYAQVPAGEYVIVGTQGEHVVQNGQTLRTIALAVYGSKELADYIIVHNNILEPNSINKGAVIKLPKLRKR